jgi:hypothetical protein
MVNPQNGVAAVRTLLLDDKWIPGKVKLEGDNLIFTYNTTDVKLTFRLDNNLKKIYTGTGSELTKVSSEFLIKSHY